MPEELKQIIFNCEDSHHAFKTNVTKGITLAREIIAFANRRGGTIFIGVNDECEIEGLNQDDIKRLNQLAPRGGILKSRCVNATDQAYPRGCVIDLIS